jgi:ATP-dependent DNA helicase RecQ
MHKWYFFMFDSMLSVLKRFFGYDSFRVGQNEVVEKVAQGRDLVVVMPTGGGKSLCYQVPALHMDGMCIVISPLISLMKDQVDALQKKSISAYFINSSISREEVDSIMALVMSNKVKLLYMSPEKLESDEFKNILSRVKLSFIAVDETHCVSQWGNDFRPAYKRLGENIDYISARVGYRIPRLALTATATEDAIAEVKDFLSMSEPETIVKGFMRTNLALRVISTEDKKDALLKLITPEDKGVIVYSSTAKNVKAYAEMFEDMGYSTAAYHGKMESAERSEVQDKFLKDEIRVIFATNAFGMGVDKPNVKKVIHTDLPINIENYYQEAGRAGRDGSESECYLIHSRGDRRSIEFLIEKSLPSRKAISGLAELIRNWSMDTFDIEPYQLMVILRHTKSYMLDACYQILSECGLIKINKVLGENGGFETVYEIANRNASPDYEMIHLLRSMRFRKLDWMERFAKTDKCRMAFILKYFGEHTTTDCGKCDNCIQKKAAMDKLDDVTDKIIPILRIANKRFKMSQDVIFDVAKGISSEYSILMKLHNDSDFGCLADHSGEDVKSLLDALIERQLLINNGLKVGGYYPSRRGLKVLDGTDRFYINKGVLKLNGDQMGHSGGLSDIEFINQLEIAKKAISKEFSMPAFMVFTSQQAQDLVKVKPKTTTELAECGILDKRRCDLFGDRIVSVFM